VDLPTYTNIWRIEKRLYKLYDFRLPAPLPINWIAVFTGITVPYVVLLVAIGLPFNHNLVWLYVLPPGVLTWLTTRPVIENKRLPELLVSQVRYLTEPRVWCRLTPLAEKDEMVVVAKVWHSRRDPATRKQGEVAKRGRGVLVRRDHDRSPVPAVPAVAPEPAARQGRTRTSAGLAAAVGSNRAQIAPPVLLPPLLQARAQASQDAALYVAVSPDMPSQGMVPPEAMPQEAVLPVELPQETAPAELSAVREVAPDEVAPEELPPHEQRVRARAGVRPPVRVEVAHDVAPAAPGHASFAPQRHPQISAFQTQKWSQRAQSPEPPHGPVREPRDRDAGASETDNAREISETNGTPANSDETQAGEPIAAEETRVTGDSDALGETAEDAISPAAALRETAAAPPAPVVREVAAPAASPAPGAGFAPARPVPSIERALAKPGRGATVTEGFGWRRKVKVVTGATQGPGTRDQEALDRDRARLPLSDPKRILVLGCTSGAGQTVTALMTGYILASLREHPVASVDLHDGALARHMHPAAQLGAFLDGAAPEVLPSAALDGLPPGGRTETLAGRLDIIANAHDDDDRDGPPLAEPGIARLAERLGDHYQIALLDPGPSGLTRLLGIADQLVVVVPASGDAAPSLTSTRDWLGAHGFAELATRSVILINGVSRRSMTDVEAAESVARGRCRAIVRVPWDDSLPVGAAGPTALLPQTRVAYTALAGVLVAGMVATPVRAN
jgi:hypothetical protein